MGFFSTGNIIKHVGSFVKISLVRLRGRVTIIIIGSLFLPPSTCPTCVRRGPAPIVLRNTNGFDHRRNGFYDERPPLGARFNPTEETDPVRFAQGSPSRISHVRRVDPPCFQRMSAQAGPHPVHIVAIHSLNFTRHAPG